MFLRRSDGWQHEFIYYSSLFSPPNTLSRDKLARIPLLRGLRTLDPGVVAERQWTSA